MLEHELLERFASRRLEGIKRYVDTLRVPWRLRRFRRQGEGDVLAAWQPDAVLALVRVLQPLPSGIPSVHVRTMQARGGAHVVQADEEQIGRVAASHFLDRRFTRFAFLGLETPIWSSQRRDGFQSVVERAGFRCEFEALALLPEERPSGRIRLGKRAERWVKGLASGTAVFAATDTLAMAVLQECVKLEREVPEDLAVLGVDNLGMECELSDPPLSSVENPMSAIGFRAAEVLDRLLRGEAGVPRQTLVRSPGVRTRHSTEVTAVDDPLVARAVAVMRRQMDSWRGLDDLAAKLGASRTTLHRRFVNSLGVSPLRELQRLRADRIEEWLDRSDLPIAEIAERCGLSGPSHLNRIFSASRGVSADTYRKGSTRDATPGRDGR